MIHCVLHDAADTVAVVVVEGVSAGTAMTGWVMDDDRTIALEARQDIPIGHKVALKDMAPGDTVVKYGIDMGKVGRPDPARRARARPQHQDQALVGRASPHVRRLERHHLPRLPARERPRRRPQLRHRPAARRPLERGRRGGRAQHQGRAGDPASVRAAPVRRRPRAPLPDADRRRLQSERRRGRRHRHRGRLDQEGRRRHRRDRQARRRLRHRGPRRPRHDHARLEGGARIRPVGEREAARAVPDRRAVGLDQVRRERHHLGLRRQSDRRQRLRQAPSARQLPLLRRDDRAHRRRADRRRALRQRRGAPAVHVHVRSLPEGDRPPQDERPLRLAADQGQHRRRPDDDRGEGARQHPEDRQGLHRRRRHRQGRGADATRASGSWTRRAPRPRW